MQPSEQLFVWRRLVRLSQADVAEMYGLHQTAISKMEAGKLKVAAPVAESVSNISIRHVPKYLMLAVKRRRLGWSIDRVRRLLGISAKKIGAMERGWLDVDAVYVRLLKKS